MIITDHGNIFHEPAGKNRLINPVLHMGTTSIPFSRSKAQSPREPVCLFKICPLIYYEFEKVTQFILQLMKVRIAGDKGDPDAVGCPGNHLQIISATLPAQSGTSVRIPYFHNCLVASFYTAATTISCLFVLILFPEVLLRTS